MAASRFRSFLGLVPHAVRVSQTRRLSSSISQIQNVGFIGLGNMGSRMANNLIQAGYSVHVHDLNKNVLNQFSEKGASIKETPAELAESSNVVITMLPSPAHMVRETECTSFAFKRLASSYEFPATSDSWTIDPQTSRKVSALVSKCLLREMKETLGNPMMLDAPVSGGVPAAEAGTLTFMVGGPEEAHEAAKPIFLAMGKNIVYCGGSGNGSAKDLSLAALSAKEIGLKCPLTSQSHDICVKTVMNIETSLVCSVISTLAQMSNNKWLDRWMQRDAEQSMFACLHKSHVTRK